MYFLKRNTTFKSLWSCLRFYSLGKKSHYEILNLKKNCTDKEIKDAFIQLSKEYHPDKNKNAKAQETFVKVVEAYNVLSKPSSRSLYDRMSEVEGHSNVYRNHAQANYTHNQNYGFYNAQSNKSTNYSSDSYYGVKGIHRLPNIAIIIIAFGIAFVGVVLQIVVIRKSYFIQRKQTEEKSIRLAEELEKVRAAARGKTRDMQTQVLLDKIVTAANPSVATASLGQSLAEDKK